MTPAISEKVKDLIARVDALLDEVAGRIADETVPAEDRMNFASGHAGRIQGLLGEVFAEGVGQDHPALGGVGAKVHSIGERLEALAAAGGPPPG